MKILFILPILFIGLNLYGQTDSIERAVLYNKILSKKMDQVAYAETCLAWVQILKEIVKYPDLPLEQNGQVHYIFLNDFKDLSKEKLFNRTLEWLLIRNGLVPASLYSNHEDGKIILRNGISIDTDYTCTYTSRITIKDNKILLEFINIGYQRYYAGDQYSSERTINFNINQVYPVILKKSTEWKSNLILLRKTNELFNLESESLFDYIINYDSVFKF